MKFNDRLQCIELAAKFYKFLDENSAVLTIDEWGQVFLASTAYDDEEILLLTVVDVTDLDDISEDIVE